jgi:hypothetical protein
MGRSFDEAPKSFIAKFVANGTKVGPRPERKHAPKHEILVLFGIERRQIDVPKEPRRVAHDDFRQSLHVNESTTPARFVPTAPAASPT